MISIKTKSFRIRFKGRQNLAGYAFKRQPVDTTDKSLPACASIILDSKKTLLCIINIPFVAIDHEVYSKIKNILVKSLKINDILVTVSHTHSAPSISEAYSHLWKSDEKLRTNIINQICTQIKNLNTEQNFLPISNINVLKSEKIPAIYRRVNTIFGMKMLPNYRKSTAYYVYKILFYSDTKLAMTFIIGDMHPTSNVDMTSVSNDYFDLFDDAKAHFMPGLIGDVRPKITQRSLKTLISTFGRFSFAFSRKHQGYEKFEDMFKASIEFRCIHKIILTEQSNVRLDKKGFKLSDIFDTNSELGLFVTHVSFSNIDFVFLTSEISSVMLTNSPNRMFISCCAPYSGYLPDISQIRFGGYEVTDNRHILLNDNTSLQENKKKWNKFILYLEGVEE